MVGDSGVEDFEVLLPQINLLLDFSLRGTVCLILVSPNELIQLPSDLSMAPPKVVQ